MTWYTAFYGSWKDPNGVQRIPGSYDRKVIFRQAQEIADRLQTEVCILSECGSPNGLICRSYTIKPTTI